MTKIEYRKEREKRGSRYYVGSLLGESFWTIKNRETGRTGITDKAAQAITLLPIPNVPVRYLHRF